MTLEQVIEAKEKMVGGSPEAYHVFGTFLFMIFIAGMILVFLHLVSDSYDTWNKRILFGIVMAIVGMGGTALCFNQIDDFEKAQYKLWKKQIAVPFVEELPVQKRDIVFAKLDTKGNTKKSATSAYTYQNDSRLTPLLIGFNEGELITERGHYETYMVLKTDETPYVEYQKVTKTLGEGLKKGYYNVKVYLPTNYQFETNQ